MIDTLMNDMTKIHSQLFCYPWIKFRVAKSLWVGILLISISFYMVGNNNAATRLKVIKNNFNIIAKLYIDVMLVLKVQ